MLFLSPISDRPALDSMLWSRNPQSRAARATSLPVLFCEFGHSSGDETSGIALSKNLRMKVSPTMLLKRKGRGLSILESLTMLLKTKYLKLVTHDVHEN